MQSGECGLAQGNTDGKTTEGDAPPSEATIQKLELELVQIYKGAGHAKFDGAPEGGSGGGCDDPLLEAAVLEGKVDSRGALGARFDRYLASNPAAREVLMLAEMNEGKGTEGGWGSVEKKSGWEQREEERYKEKDSANWGGWVNTTEAYKQTRNVQAKALFRLNWAKERHEDIVKTKTEVQEKSHEDGRVHGRRGKTGRHGGDMVSCSKPCCTSTIHCCKCVDIFLWAEDISKGEYTCFSNIVRYEGGKEDPAAVIAASNYCKKAIALGPPWVKWNNMTERMEILYVKDGVRDTFRKAWKMKTVEQSKAVVWVGVLFGGGNWVQNERDKKRKVGEGRVRVSTGQGKRNICEVLCVCVRCVFGGAHHSGRRRGEGFVRRGEWGQGQGQEQGQRQTQGQGQEHRH